jgi:Ca-activated chloride channel homolog
MTFGFLAPWLGWLICIAGIAAGLAAFLVKARPSRHVVPSLLIWQRVMDDRRERSLWERIRWVISLCLALTIAMALTAAFVRPKFGFSKASVDRVLIVLDSSWTMAARRSDGSTRWEQAIREAAALVRSAEGAAVALATTAEGLVEGPTSDMARVTSALERLRPTGGADATWPRVAGSSAVHFITDGATPRSVETGVTLHSVFQPAGNVAVSAFDVAESSGGAKVFLAVTNHATGRQEVALAVTRGTTVVVNRTVLIDAGATHREAFIVPLSGGSKFKAEVKAANNALDVDDEAAAWLWSASPLAVGVVGTDSTLPALLAEDPTLRVTRVPPDQYGRVPADVWVFDGWLPGDAPAKPALIVGPPATSWLGTTSAGGPASTWQASGSHPLLDGVDGALVRIDAVRRLSSPRLRAVVVSESGAPVVSAGDGLVRIVVLGFALAESNLAMSPAFPVLIGNAIDWLGRPDRGRHREPGPVVLARDTVRLVSPNGQMIPLTTMGDAKVATLDRPGVYLAESTGAPRVFTVSLGHPERSDLLVSSIQTDSDTRAAVAQPISWWRIAAWIALGLVVVEWFSWQRRVTV